MLLRSRAHTNCGPLPRHRLSGPAGGPAALATDPSGAGGEDGEMTEGGREVMVGRQASVFDLLERRDRKQARHGGPRGGPVLRPSLACLHCALPPWAARHAQQPRSSRAYPSWGEGACRQAAPQPSSAALRCA